MWYLPISEGVPNMEHPFTISWSGNNLASQCHLCNIRIKLMQCHEDDASTLVHHLDVMCSLGRFDIFLLISIKYRKFCILPYQAKVVGHYRVLFTCRSFCNAIWDAKLPVKNSRSPYLGPGKYHMYVPNDIFPCFSIKMYVVGIVFRSF